MLGLGVLSGEGEGGRWGLEGQRGDSKYYGLQKRLC